MSTLEQSENFLPLASTIFSYASIILTFVFKFQLIGIVLATLSVFLTSYMLSPTFLVKGKRLRLVDINVSMQIALFFLLLNVIFKMLIFPTFQSLSDSLVSPNEFSVLMSLFSLLTAIIYIIIMTVVFFYFIKALRKLASYKNYFEALGSDKGRFLSIESIFGSSAIIVGLFTSGVTFFVVATIATLSLFNKTSEVFLSRTRFKSNKDNFWPYKIVKRISYFLKRISIEEILQRIITKIKGSGRGGGYIFFATSIGIIVAFYSNSLTFSKIYLYSDFVYALLLLAALLILFYTYKYYDQPLSKMKLKLLPIYMIVVFILVIISIYPRYFLPYVIFEPAKYFLPIISDIAAIVNWFFFVYVVVTYTVISTIALIVDDIVERDSEKVAKKFLKRSIFIFIAYNITIAVGGIEFFSYSTHLNLSLVSKTVLILAFLTMGCMTWYFSDRVGFIWASTTKP